MESASKSDGAIRAVKDVRVCEELRGILNRLRKAEQNPEDQFIGMSKYTQASCPQVTNAVILGNICRTPLQDIAFPVDVLPTAGPFPTVKAFHDWFSLFYRRRLAGPDVYPQDSYCSSLPDDAPIKLTHGVLHRSNIVITKIDPPHVAALIDWHQAGWLPAYREVHKAMYTADPRGEWLQDYIPRFLEKWDDSTEVWDFYVSATAN
jgi:hypothetical protein